MTKDRRIAHPELSPEGRIEKAQKTFMRRLQARFFLRFHMSLILLATALSGVLSSKLLLLLDINFLMLRYPLAVLFAYLAFFCFVKLWLLYLTRGRTKASGSSGGDLLSDLPDLSGGSGSGGGSISISGGGGSSGGGGASGFFEAPVPNTQAVVMPTGGSSGSSSGGFFDSLGDGLSGLFDDDGIVLIALGLLLAATIGGAGYLIWIAPPILSEAAFDVLLGTSLLKSYRRMNQPDWMGSVFKDTYKPFLVVLVVAFIAAWMIHHHDPNLTRLSDLFRRGGE
jgi:hypothetical protein